MKTRIALAARAVAAMAACFLLAVSCDDKPKIGPQLDEAKTVGRTAESFPAADENYFRDMDGGIDLCRIDPGTGKILSRTPICSPDPQTGKQPFSDVGGVMSGERSDILSGDAGHVYLRDQTYSDGGQRAIGPDAVIGWAKGTRGADSSALGEVAREVLTDNDKAWSGDHEMDPPSVPGILATSRPLKRPARDLRELNASVLAEFGLETAPSAR